MEEKMIRKIIQIDQERCNGCGACAQACHENAIIMVDGKATLVRDDYCDGLGDCLPVCKMGAITFTMREAAAYDEAAVLANQKQMQAQKSELPCGCKGTQSRKIERTKEENKNIPLQEQQSRLSQWPVQIKLVPVEAPYFDEAKLLIAADCTAYAYASFHEKFMKGYVTLVGCPKLDCIDYTEKITEILMNHEIKRLTLVRMEVPCCGGLEHAAKTALQSSGKLISGQVVTISIDGRILQEEEL